MINSKVYIYELIIFLFFFKGSVNSEKRLQNRFLWYKDGLLLVLGA